MANGYTSSAEGMDWINERFARIESMLAAMNGANGAESLVITGPNGITAYDPETGGRANISRGSIWLWDDYDANPENAGQIYCDPGAGTNYLRMFPPFSDGTGLENSVTVQGRRPGQAGNVWLYSDGQLVARVQDSDGNLTGNAFLHAAQVFIAAPTQLELNTPQLGLYSLPTTSAAANLHLGTVGGVWTVAYVTSSRRYKRDIRPTTVRPENVLAVEPVTFLEKTEVEAVGAGAPWRQGFIAEQVAEHTPQFVGLDDDGDPNSVDYDRLAAVGHQVVLQDHEARLVAAEAENAELRTMLADALARIEALEAA